MSSEQNAVVTPEPRPVEAIIGLFFAAPSFERIRTEIYYCDSYDRSVGYLMVNVNAPADHRTVSSHAIGHTWLQAEDRGHHWWVAATHLRIEKSELLEGLG